MIVALLAWPEAANARKISHKATRKTKVSPPAREVEKRREKVAVKDVKVPRLGQAYDAAPGVGPRVVKGESCQGNGAKITVPVVGP